MGDRSAESGTMSRWVLIETLLGRGCGKVPNWRWGWSQNPFSKRRKGCLRCSIVPICSEVRVEKGERWKKSRTNKPERCSLMIKTL